MLKILALIIAVAAPPVLQGIIGEAYNNACYIGGYLVGSIAATLFIAGEK